MTLFQDKYRVESTRKKEHDYSADGCYLITICTANREWFLGEIIGECENAGVKLSPIGKIAEKFWCEIPDHFQNVILDEFIVMPNHIHGIISIVNDDKKRSDNHNSCDKHDSRRDVACNVSTKQTKFMSKISPKQKSISVIIRSFKSAVTRHATKNNLNSRWQPRFHDHVIRDENELNRIRKYIVNNPAKWEIDQNNQDDDMHARVKLA